jgi:hypothetical protein
VLGLQRSFSLLRRVVHKACSTSTLRDRLELRDGGTRGKFASPRTCIRLWGISGIPPAEKMKTNMGKIIEAICARLTRLRPIVSAIARGVVRGK